MNHRPLIEWLDRTDGIRRGMSQGPLVTLAYAQSIDGSISAEQGKPTPLSGPDASEATHIIRSRHGGIMVGVGTLVADNPRLNVRLVSGLQPRPVILDPHLRSPLDRRLWSQGRHPIVFCGEDAHRDQESALKNIGVEIRRIETDDQGQLSLPAVLRDIKSSGIDTLMVEGGGRIITAFIDGGYWDRVAVTIVPQWINGYRPDPSETDPIRKASWISYGSDVFLVGERV